MASLDLKKDLILRYEEKFADRVAVSVIDKPKLSIWMILIPIIFIHFFYRMKKFSDGRKEFVRHFTLTRKRTLEEAAASLESGNRPNLQALVNLSSAPGKTHSDYKEWLKVLLDHYQSLLCAEGDSFEDMIRSVYKNRGNYLLYINQLNRVERQFNTALKPSLKETANEVNHIVKAIEQRCEALRREEADKFFS